MPHWQYKNLSSNLLINNLPYPICNLQIYPHYSQHKKINIFLPPFSLSSSPPTFLNFLLRKINSSQYSMYPSSTSSSSSQGSLGPNGGVNSSSAAGLIRYGSAPSSFLAAAVDSAMNPGLGSHHPHMGSPAPPNHHPGASSSSGRLFFPSSEASTQLASEPSCRASHSNDYINGGAGRAYGLNHEVTMGAGGGVVVPSSNANAAPPRLVRHSSSPAGFLNQLAHAACTSNDDSGYTTAGASGVSRLNSQLSFTRQETLSKISEESENVANGLNVDNEKRNSTHSYSTGNYGGASWEDAHTIMFSMGPSKRPKNISSEVISGLTSMESQFQFGMPHTMLEMASMDKLLNIPEDSVPCKIRAKRGCATHPRSIAERERRTRISGKLKKLQDLVPNMDKQTSYADMLDLAVQHIKGLQNQVQKLNKELENCTCGCRKPRNPFGEEKS